MRSVGCRAASLLREDTLSHGSGPEDAKVSHRAWFLATRGTLEYQPVRVVEEPARSPWRERGPGSLKPRCDESLRRDEPETRLREPRRQGRERGRGGR